MMTVVDLDQYHHDHRNRRANAHSSAHNLAVAGSN
jgi:hypothetical protein